MNEDQAAASAESPSEEQLLRDESPKLSIGNLAEAENSAREWTSTLMRVVRDEPSPAGEILAPLATFRLVDLSDVRAEVLRFGRQLRDAELLGRDIPVLTEPSSDLPMPVDLAAAAGAEMPGAADEADQWFSKACEATFSLADASALSYEFLSVPQVTDILEARTTAFVMSRFMASFGGGKAVLYPIRVHTSAAGLRVHYSANIAWSPMFFGAPSPIVSGQLQAGHFQFGVDGPGMRIKKDKAVFDIPQIQDAYLTVA